MIEGIERLKAGQPLIGQDTMIPYDKIRSEQRTIGIDEPWQQVGAFAGEFAHVAGGVA
jgi:hypothetical protein